MGNYSIVIEGFGAHGFNDYPDNAEAHAARLVRGLLEAGHNITHAMVHAGGGRCELVRDAVTAPASLADPHPLTAVKVTRSDGAPAIEVRSYLERGQALYERVAPLLTTVRWGDLDESARDTWAGVAMAMARS